MGWKPFTQVVKRVQKFLGDRVVWMRLSAYTDRVHGGAASPEAASPASRVPGNTATSKECRETMEVIAHPAVQICYDAGNVHFYEGLAPEDDVVPILPHVKALCLKDHQGPRANANFPVPGEGAVDHRLLFSRLKEGGFSGPMVLERVDGTMKKAEMPLELVVERITRARRNMETALAAVGATIT